MELMIFKQTIDGKYSTAFNFLLTPKECDIYREWHKIWEWCEENLETDDYEIDHTCMMVYSLNEETDVAMKLRWYQ